VLKLSVPLLERLRVWGREITAREFVFVRVSAGGCTGTGFALSRGMALDSVLERQLKPLALDKPASAIRAIWNSARAAARMTTETGIYMRALSLLDLALWDLLGQLSATPLWRMLGGAMDRVPCLAICGYYRPGDATTDWRTASLNVIRAEGERLRAAGYARFKIPFGEDIDLDVHRIRALRETVGQDAMIGLDASGVFNSIKDAHAAWRRIESLGVDFLEDPFPADAPELAAQLAREVPVRVAYGESITSPQVLQSLSVPSGLDIVRPDATVLGGITGFVQAIGPALEHRVRIFPHYYPDIHAHLAAAFGLDMIEESPDQTDTVGFAPLRAQQPRIVNGHWHMTDTPGLGIVWNEAALMRARQMRAR
jgi:D-arabinonate dehydratase